jgi:hypothetical protein
MKRIARPLAALVLAIAVLAPATAHGQSHAVDRGSILAAGNASFTSTGSNLPGGDGRVTALVLQPRLQYFVQPGLAVGGEVTLTRFSRGSNSTTSYGVGPSASYYFGADQARPFHPYVGAGVQYARFDTGSFSSSTVGGRAAAGIAFMLSSAVALDGSVFYATTRRHGEEPNFGTDVVGVAVGVAAFVF